MEDWHRLNPSTDKSGDIYWDKVTSFVKARATGKEFEFEKAFDARHAHFLGDCILCRQNK